LKHCKNSIKLKVPAADKNIRGRESEGRCQIARRDDHNPTARLEGGIKLGGNTSSTKRLRESTVNREKASRLSGKRDGMRQQKEYLITYVDAVDHNLRERARDNASHPRKQSPSVKHCSGGENRSRPLERWVKEENCVEFPQEHEPFGVKQRRKLTRREKEDCNLNIKPQDDKKKESQNQ